VREQVVPVVHVVSVVQAARAGAVRAALVTTSLWQRGGCKDAPENNLELPVAAARTTRHCFNNPGYRGPLPTRYRR
jgi:hypothetical protein